MGNVFKTATLIGKKTESIEFKIEQDVEGFGVELNVFCPRQHTEANWQLSTITYEEPSLCNLDLLVSGGADAIFKFQAMGFRLQISKQKVGVREEIIAQLEISSLQSLDSFPWPEDAIHFVICNDETVTLLQMVFCVNEKELSDFSNSLDKCFEKSAR